MGNRAALALTLLMGLAPAATQAAEANAPAHLDAQIFSGVVSGGGLQGSAAGGLMRAGASAAVYMFRPLQADRLPSLGQGFVSLRLAESPSIDLALRVGYLYGRFDYGQRAGRAAVDHQHTLDAGLTIRVRSATGTTATLDVSREQVWRSQLDLGDRTLGSGGGWRVAVTGEVGVSSNTAFFIEGEMRTGPHLPQVGLLPSALLGFTFRL